MAIIVRKEKPPKLKNYRGYKEYLRRDFSYSCAYCDIHETEYGNQNNFSVEHFKPKEKFKELETVYENLLYACLDCNRFKSDIWPKTSDVAKGYHFLNPCEIDYELHFKLNDLTYELESLTNAARYMIAHIRLNRKFLITMREKRHLEKKIISLLNHVSNKSGTIIKKDIEDIRNNFEEFRRLSQTPFDKEELK